METSLVLSKIGINTGMVSYSENVNAFLSLGYTSLAGNTYYNEIRIANGIAIVGSLGDGYWYKFLNGIKIYSLKDKELVAEKHFHNHIYGKESVKHHAKSMLLEALLEASKEEGWSFDEKQASKEIDRIVDESFSTNQIEMLKKQARKLLNG